MFEKKQQFQGWLQSRRQPQPEAEEGDSAQGHA
jgi:hypothetical protein